MTPLASIQPKEPSKDRKYKSTHLHTHTHKFMYTFSTPKIIKESSKNFATTPILQTPKRSNFTSRERDGRNMAIHKVSTNHTHATHTHLHTPQHISICVNS